MKPADAAASVSEHRLWQRHMAMAAIGATPKGGVNRPALSPEDAAARKLLCSWAVARGFRCLIDEIGNLYIRRDGRDSTAAPVLTGSHLDSQPTGGRFDGTYGVLAGFEVLEALQDANIATRRSVEVAVWTNEEGSRFQPGTMGSAVFAGARTVADLLPVADRHGIRLADALAQTVAAIPDAEPRRTGFAVAGYVEAHIEQGPRLAIEDKTIGVVGGIQGLRWFEVEIIGEEAHAGTTPLSARKDALLAAIAMVEALRRLMHDPDDVLRFTVGRFEVFPGSPNTVPGRVLFTIDFRHPDALTLQQRGDRVAEVCAAEANGCTVTVRETALVPPILFEPTVPGLVRAAATRLGLPQMELLSGAGHDAGYLARVCPTGMIFVPCERGISHNEAENATPADLAAGARVLAEVIVDLAAE